MAGSGEYLLIGGFFFRVLFFGLEYLEWQVGMRQCNGMVLQSVMLSEVLLRNKICTNVASCIRLRTH